MHRASSTLLVVLLVALGLLAIAPARIGAHQSTPSTGCISDVTVQPLGRGQPSAAAGKELTLLRVTFAPGGSIGLHGHPGSLTLSIESGALTYAVVDGEADVVRASSDGTPAPPERLTSGDETVLRPGDWLFEQGIVHSARNDGTEPTEVLVAGLMTAGEAFTQCHEEAAAS